MTQSLVVSIPIVKKKKTKKNNAKGKGRKKMKK
jgi:hypothetical protein